MERLDLRQSENVVQKLLGVEWNYSVIDTFLEF